MAHEMAVIRQAPAALLAAAALFLAGCRARVNYFPENGVQTGTASWYGGEFQGRPTSSQEIYDMNDLTAAHNSLPLGSYAMVTNLSTGQSVVVRINDRGPFVKNRVIDLSYAAARAIGVVGPGTARVRIEALKNVAEAAPGREFSVQVGAFVSRPNAAALQEALLERDFGLVTVTPFETPQRTYYRVRVKAGSLEEARQTARRLARLGYAPIVFDEP